MKVEFKNAYQGSLIHKLAAQKLIKKYENLNSQKILQLSLQWKILSKETSFVIVDKRKDKVQGSMVAHVIKPKSSNYLYHPCSIEFMSIKSKVYKRMALFLEEEALH